MQWLLRTSDSLSRRRNFPVATQLKSKHADVTLAEKPRNRKTWQIVGPVWASADAIKTQNIASSLNLCPALSDVFSLKTAVHKMGKKSHQNLAPFWTKSFVRLASSVINSTTLIFNFWWIQLLIPVCEQYCSTAFLSRSQLVFSYKLSAYQKKIKSESCFNFFGRVE